MRIIYFPIETLNREIDTISYLSKHILCSNRADIVITGSKLILQTLLRLGLLPRGVWHVKSAQNYTFPLLTRLKRNGFLVSVQNAESLVTFDTSERFDPFVISPKVVHLINIIFCANENEYLELSTFHGSKVADRLCISGFIRSALTKNEAKEYYRHEIDVINREIGQYILYNSTAGLKYHFHSDFDFHSLRHMLVAQGVLPDHADDLMKWSEQSQGTLFAFLEFVRLFTNKHGDKGIKIIFRPHPSEDLSFFKKLFSTHATVTVDLRYSVMPWLLNSIVTIGSTSTTLIEGAAYGLPTISFVPEIESEVMDLLYQNDSNKCGVLTRTPAELFKAVSECIDSPDVSKSHCNKDLASSLVGSQYDTFDIVSRKMGELFSDINHLNFRNKLLLFILPFSIFSVDIILRLFTFLTKRRQFLYASYKFHRIDKNLLEKILKIGFVIGSKRLFMKLISKKILILGIKE